ncbi:MAG TPA: SPOR domain-containing protein [Gammaproteobacteria bacterium]|nr:SPOR domain-containing protein [Gammaproteobacteria bacterium]
MSTKERVIGACVLVALAVIFIPMFLKGPAPDATVTKAIDLPGPSTEVRTYRMNLADNSPPKPISPLVAEGKVPRPSGTIDRSQAASQAAGRAAPAQPAPSTMKTVAIDVPPPAAKSKPAADPKPAADEPKAAQPAADTADNRPGWAVQVGSFSNRENAERLTKQLKDKGFHAFVKTYTSHGKTYYRVRVGPVDQRRDAERLAPTVAAASGGPTKIVPNP